MKEVVQLMNEMKAAGVIQNYAIFGAIAQVRYTEPVITLDVDRRGFWMREILELMEREARWQKSRQDLPWAEKIRMIERVRDGFARWRDSVRKRASLLI